MRAFRLCSTLGASCCSNTLFLESKWADPVELKRGCLFGALASFAERCRVVHIAIVLMKINEKPTRSRRVSVEVCAHRAHDMQGI